MPADRDPPDGTDSTFVAPAGNPALAETRAEDTLAPGSDVVRRIAGPSSRPGLGAKPASSGTRTLTVGQEMQAASIERFGTVPSDRFELLDELARGGLGRVFRARDPRTNRIVAIKEVLRPQPEIILRFAREAMVTANLQHPSIVPVYEVGRWDNGEPFYAMKLVQGRTLDALIAEATTTEARIALVPHVIAVADALAYAHSEHVIHRDLKPANVLVGAYGETVVIDWGLAKNLATGEELEALPIASTIPPDQGETVAGAVLGTPAYMPPEQATGERLDEHADVYGIGAILYHVLTGTRPFAEARTFDELIYLVTSQPPRPIATLAPNVPAELIAIAEKAMSRVPADRYATAEGLAQDLRRYQAGKLVGAHRYTAGQLVRRWIARHRAIVVTTLIALAVLITIGTLGIVGIARERDEATRQRELARAERAEAEKQRGVAEDRYATSLVELARQALLAGAPDRALPLLAGAATIAASGHAPVSPVLSLLAHEARAAYSGLIAIAPTQPFGTRDIALTDDGARLFSTGMDGALRAWDFAARRAAWTAPDTRLIALSPDGTLLVCVAETGEVVLRRADTGAEQARWPATARRDEELATVIAWAPDGDHFALATPLGRVFVGARAAKALTEIPGHTAAVYSLELSPDGRSFLTASKDGSVLIHDAITGAVTTRLVEGKAPLAAAIWLDVDHVVTGDDNGTVRVWHVRDHRIVQTLQHGAAIYGLVAGGGSAPWLASYGDGAIVTLWDLATGSVRAKLGGHQLGCDRAVTDGRMLITTDEAGTAYVWDPTSGQRVQTISSEGANIGVKQRAGRVVVFGESRERVYRFEPDDVVRQLRGHTARIRDLAFSRDGTTLWTASNDGTARGFDLATGTTRVLGTGGFTEPPIAVATPASAQPPPNPHGLRSLRLSPDGTLIVTAAEDGALIAWDARTGAARAHWVGHTGRVRRVVFSADGRTAYSVGDTTLRRWDVATGKQLAQAEVGVPLWDVALLGGDGVVATFADAPDLGIALWHASDLSPIARAAGQDRLRELGVLGDRLLIADPAQIVALDATGKHVQRATLTSAFSFAIDETSIAIGNSHAQIAIFDRTTFAPQRSWPTNALAAALAFRPGGQLLASASGQRVRLWDPATGRLLGELELPVLITQLAWSPDGTHLALAGGGGTAWIWNLAPGDVPRLGAFARCASTWTLVDTTLVAAPFDPGACSMLSH